MYKRKLRFHTFRIKTPPPPVLYPLFWHQKNSSSKNLQKYILMWHIYDQKMSQKVVICVDYAQKCFCGCAKVRVLNTLACFFFAIVSRKVILQHFKVSFWNFRDQSVHFSGYKIIIKLLLLSILKTLLHFKIYNMILLISKTSSWNMD